MEIKDNFSIFNLFLDKKVKIFIDNRSFYVKVPTIKELSLDEILNSSYHIWIQPVDKMKKMLPMDFKDSFEFLNIILFQLGIYQEYNTIAYNFKKTLSEIVPNIEIDYKNKQLIVNDIIITSEIWEYVLYVLRLSCGEKVEKPRTFTSEAERQFYLAQKKMDEKIKSIKAQKPGDSDSLIKSFLTIQYVFNLSFDYLAEQTLAQIQWLQGYAAGAVSYEVNAQAFAAGNMKKGKKLDFFIK